MAMVFIMAVIYNMATVTSSYDHGPSLLKPKRCSRCQLSGRPLPYARLEC